MLLNWEFRQENSEFQNYLLKNLVSIKITLEVFLREKKARGIYSESIDLVFARCFQVQVRGRVYKQRKLVFGE